MRVAVKYASVLRNICSSKWQDFQQGRVKSRKTIIITCVTGPLQPVF